MAIRADLDYQIKAISELFDDFIEFNDSIDITDSDEKKYQTSDTLLYNTKVCAISAIQFLEQQKRDSLTEYEYITKQDSTIYNICFEVHGIVNDETMEQLIEANDLFAFNRTDIDPNNPIIKKNTKIIYYK